MPRRFNFIVTNNPLGKDKYADAKPRQPWKFLLCPGGAWHLLSEEGGEITKDKYITSQVEGLTTGINRAWLTLPNGQSIYVFALQDPEGRRWTCHSREWKEDEWKPAENKVGPMYG